MTTGRLVFKKDFYWKQGKRAHIGAINRGNCIHRGKQGLCSLSRGFAEICKGEKSRAQPCSSAPFWSETACPISAAHLGFLSAIQCFLLERIW